MWDGLGEKLLIINGYLDDNGRSGCDWLLYINL